MQDTDLFERNSAGDRGGNVRRPQNDPVPAVGQGSQFDRHRRARPLRAGREKQTTQLIESSQRTYQNNLLFELQIGRLIWQRSCFCTVNHPVWLTYEAGLNLNAFYSVLDAKLEKLVGLLTLLLNQKLC